VHLRFATAAAVSLWLAAGFAFAQTCPPDCPLKGGGAPATDCLLEFDGPPAKSPGSRIIECVDGDPTCDQDPTPGTCGIDLRACIQNADPTLATCQSTQIDGVRIVAGDDGHNLATAIQALLPASENTCTAPVRFSVRAQTKGGAPLGRRRFSLFPPSSIFQINTLPLGRFSGFVEAEAGPVDPETGLAVINILSTSEFIAANIEFGGLALCLKPSSEPVMAAGVISCERRGGRVVRATVYNSETSDRDLLLLRCRANTAVNYTTVLQSDHNLGVVGQDGFTAEACTALGGSVEDDTDPHPGVCNSSFTFGQLEDTSTDSGEVFIAPVPQLGINGFPVEIITETALPCGDEGGGGGMSAAIALTTMRSAGRILDANDSPGVTLEFGVEGQPFDCNNFGVEDGPGRIVFAAPQLHLPILMDGVTQFVFSDR
jgi:hypothetical protein